MSRYPHEQIGRSTATRTSLLARTFVDVADTLVVGFDVVEFLSTLVDRCVELLDVSEAGILLADPSGRLRVVASSSHRMELLEVLELQENEGPCLDSYRTGRQVRGERLDLAHDRWPRVAPEAVAARFTAGYGIPMRLRDRTIGALNLLRTQPGPLSDEDLEIAQALADAATFGILQQRAASESRLAADQLQVALDSRITIEQAKGILGEHAGIDVEEAFADMRRYARSRNENLSEVARAIVERRLTPGVVFA